MSRAHASLLALTLLIAGAPAAAEGFPPEPRPAADAPNVLIVMTDDVGFAASSTFGGGVPTPTLDALAQNGLSYVNFHTTAICSATRAALLTGRNAHAVGFGTVSDLARPEPGYNSIIPKSAASMGRIFANAGWDTAWLGKHHNVPTWHGGPMGPYDQWASGLGFRYFYGFHGGFTDQFHPQLIENDRMVEPPAGADYILDRDMADRAIGWLRNQSTQHPGRPFLMYYAPGTAHAPLQAPADWLARFRGKFDSGWDAYRADTLARQKRMGLVPKDAALAPLPEGTRAWSALSPDERAVAARYMEAYAAMLAYCDDQIGRVIGELRQSGRLDNTLVVFIQGDNGASGEGGATGAFDYVTRVSGGVTQQQEQAHALAHIDKIGGPDSYVVGPVGWAAALNTPFPYYKVVASRLGGVRNGMVVSWPKRLAARGVRRQFTHVSDVLPTVLEAAGLTAPTAVDGVPQSALDGVSFAYSFAQPQAPSRRKTQYFEVFGHAAIYHDGWLAAEALHVDPRRGGAMPDPAAPWSLYDLSRDFSQTRDLAAERPDKLAELKAVWAREAARNQVLPLTTSNVAAMMPGVRPEPLSEPGRHVFHPSAARYPEGVFPAINNRSWTIEAELTVPASGAPDGALVTQGGQASGWALVMLRGAPTFYYRANDRDSALFRLAADAPLQPGKRTVAISFASDGPGFGRGGQFRLTVDGKPAGSGRVETTVPFKFAAEDGTIGWDAGTAVSRDYAAPFRYPAGLERVTFALEPAQPLAGK